MLTTKKCDLTGVVNLCPVLDPLMSVGVVVRRPGSDRFDWHYHFDGVRAGGTVTDWASGEAAIRSYYSQRVRERNVGGTRAA